VSIAASLKAVEDEIGRACLRAGRDPDSIVLVAVSKTYPPEAIREAAAAGVRHVGENRVQELLAKHPLLEDVPLHWHMIGHLQRNKVRQILPSVCMIHSVDSLRLAEELDARAERLERVVDVLLQVNCSKESQKFGCAVGAATHLAELVCTLKHLRLRGLMTMAPLTEDAEGARPAFVRLRELFEEMRHDGIGGDDLQHLSMGMSHDYPVAVEEGATILRIGSALFA